MKNRIIRLTVVAFIAITVFIVACRKNATLKETAKTSTLTTDLSVKDARSYFYNTLRKSQSQSMFAVGSSPDGKNRKVFPYWSHAYASKTKRYAFIEVPVASVHQERSLRSLAGQTMTDAEAKSILSASFRRLVLYKNKNGAVNQRLITFIPDYAYLKRHNNDVSYNHIDKLDKDFSGYLEYRDWNNTLLFTFRMENGKVKSRLTPNSKQTKQQVQSLKTNTDGCITYEITDWEQDCIDFSDPDNPEAGVVTVCGDWYIADQYEEVECTGIDCSDPANFDNPDCNPDPVSPEAVYNAELEMTESNYTDDDLSGPDGAIYTTGYSSGTFRTMSANQFAYTPIQYKYPVSIGYEQDTRAIVWVEMGDCLASPGSQTYYGIYGTNVTRTVTPVTTSKTWSGEVGTVECSWGVLVTLRYTYANSRTTTTRSSDASFTSPVTVP